MNFRNSPSFHQKWVSRKIVKVRQFLTQLNFDGIFWEVSNVETCPTGAHFDPHLQPVHTIDLSSDLHRRNFPAFPTSKNKATLWWIFQILVGFNTSSKSIFQNKETTQCQLQPSNLFLLWLNICHKGSHPKGVEDWNNMMNMIPNLWSQKHGKKNT